MIKIIEEFFDKKTITYTREPLPLGRGYATSASIAIGYTILSLIYNNKPCTLHTAGRIAHIAEIEARTGLGDVSAIIQGSQIPFRKTPGAPGVSIVDSIRLTEEISIITLPLGAQSTRSLLKGKIRLYREHGIKAYDKLEKNPTLETFIEASREFSIKTKMLNKEVIRKMNVIEKKTDIIGYFMKKRLLVIITKPKTTEEATEYIAGVFGTKKIRKHKPVETGVILEKT